MVTGNLFIHYVVPDYFPEKGGMQHSLRRISNSLSKYWEDSLCDYYVMNSRGSDYDNVHFIANRIKRYARSFGENGSSEQKKEHKQLQYLVLQTLLGDSIEKNPDYSHLIISFYASHAGFYAQLIASYYGIPHITSIRGSDFYTNYLNHSSFGSMDFVIQRADYVVTTNNTQKRMLINLYPKEDHNKIVTIHNAFEGECHNYQNKAYEYPNKPIRLISDGGFFYKKGTETIIDSFELLNSKDIPCELTIAGDIAEKELTYWENKIRVLHQTYGERFKAIGYCTDISSLFEQSDIYVSASLSEGCSNSRIMALNMGMPVVTTNVGAIMDFPFDYSFVHLVPIGGASQMAKGIALIMKQLRENQQVVSDAEMKKRHEYFSLIREQDEWVKLIQNLPNL